MKMVGYLRKETDGLHGERGQAYDYVLASNGVFITGQNEFIAARIPVAPAEIRGVMGVYADLHAFSLTPVPITAKRAAQYWQTDVEKLFGKELS